MDQMPGTESCHAANTNIHLLAGKKRKAKTVTKLAATTIM